MPSDDPSRIQLPPPNPEKLGGMLYERDEKMEAAIHVRGRQELFLNTWADVGDATKACKVSGVAWKSHEHWMAKDPAYRGAVGRVKRFIGHKIAGKEVDLALNGVERGVYWEGEKIDTYHEYDHKRSLTLLKAYLKDEFNPPQEIDIKTRDISSLQARLKQLEDENASIVDAELVKPDDSGHDDSTPPVGIHP